MTPTVHPRLRFLLLPLLVACGAAASPTPARTQRAEEEEALHADPPESHGEETADASNLPLEAWAEAAAAAGELFDAPAVRAAYAHADACAQDELAERYDAATTRPRVFRMAAATVVWTVCEIGAYQEVGRVFAVVDGRATALTLDYVAEDGQRRSRPLTGWFEFDPSTGEARDHIKYRGIGDCGSLGLYRFVDGRFELVEYRARECDEDWEGDEMPTPAEWPRLFPRPTHS